MVSISLENAICSIGYSLTGTRCDMIRSIELLTFRKRFRDAQTPVWQFNYTDWSFIVYVKPNDTISYPVIAAVVQRFLVLLPSPATQSPEGARVGRIEVGTDRQRIANVGFIPLTTDSTVTDVADDPPGSSTTLFGPDKSQNFTLFAVNGTQLMNPDSINATSLLDWVNTTVPESLPGLVKRYDTAADAPFFLRTVRTLTYLSLNHVIISATFELWHTGAILASVPLIAAGLLGAATGTWFLRILFERWARNGMTDLRTDPLFPREQFMSYHNGRLGLRIIFRAHDQWRYFGKDLQYPDLFLATLAGIIDHLRGLPIEQPVPGLHVRIYEDVPDNERSGGERQVPVMDVDITAGEVPRAEYRDEL